MEIIPAVDIKDNRCVRLVEGKFDKVKDYLSPMEGALKWSKEGAKLIHIVDLDGALGNRAKNKDSIHSIIDNIVAPLQFGGGVRNKRDVLELIEMGFSRVVIGSLALLDYEATRDLIGEFGDRIVIAVDGIGGKVAYDAWQQKSEIEVSELLKTLIGFGLKRAIVTDIARDGKLEGPNLGLYRSLKDLDIEIIASGGVATLGDIQNLADTGVAGVIIGKALYNGNFTLEEAMKCLPRG